MFDIGWPELLVIAIVLIVVVGPKDLPPMLRAFGKTTAKLRSMASEFRGQFDEALREAELDDVKKTIDEARKLNPMQSVRDAVNPLKATGESIRSDLEKTVRSPDKPAETAARVELPDPAMTLSKEPPSMEKPAAVAKETKAKVPAAKPKAKAAQSATTAAKPGASATKKASADKPTSPATAKKTPARRKKAADGEGAA